MHFIALDRINREAPARKGKLTREMHMNPRERKLGML